jgi:hypothetical protein
MHAKEFLVAFREVRSLDIASFAESLGLVPNEYLSFEEEPYKAKNHTLLKLFLYFQREGDPVARELCFAFQQALYTDIWIRNRHLAAKEQPPSLRVVSDRGNVPAPERLQGHYDNKNP